MSFDEWLLLFCLMIGAILVSSPNKWLKVPGFVLLIGVGYVVMGWAYDLFGSAILEQVQEHWFISLLLVFLISYELVKRWRVK